mgnify:CR=1 FL=1
MLFRMKEIGEYLKNRRNELGISLDEIEQVLKIRKKYLVALEEGDDSVLPGKTYFIGYLRNYANYLQVDQDFVNQLIDKSESETVSKPIDQVPRVERKKTNRPLSKIRKRMPIKEEKKLTNIIPFFKILVVILLIGGFVFIINQFFHKANSPSRSIVTIEGETDNQEKTMEQELLKIAQENMNKEEISEVGEITVLEPLPDYKPIEIVANEPGWLKITQNDEILYEGIIASEERILVKTDSLVSLITSSPNKMKVSYNGEVLEPQPMLNYRLISYQILPNQSQF